jgi:hypothetical protein
MDLNESPTMRPPPTRTDLTPSASLPALYNPRDLAVMRRTVASVAAGADPVTLRAV